MPQALLAYNPVKNCVYAPINLRNRLAVIDGDNLQILNTIITGLYCNCDVGGVIFNPRVNKIYARNFLAGDTACFSCLSLVSVIDASTGKKIKHILTGVSPTYGDRAMCLHPSGDKLYIANNESNTITVIDCHLDTVIKTLYLPESPEYLTINTTGHKLYCTHGWNPILTIIDAKGEWAN